MQKFEFGTSELLNCHRLGGLNDKLVFLAVLLFGSARPGWQQGQILDEGSLLGLQMAVFLLYPHRVLPLLG